ncbi:MAG: hypothetical protein P1P76_04350 [Anaerolineales bacterium]|nr:hypothetical protein [Anaerolineales bacterium]
MGVKTLVCPCPICRNVPHEDIRFQHQFERRDLPVDYGPDEPEPGPPEPDFHPLMDIGYLDWLEDGEWDFFGMDD